MAYSELCIDERAIVRDAMRRLDTTGLHILFLLDDAGVLSGALTDGDVRRFLLGGGSMDAPVSRAANTRPIIAASRGEAQKLLHRRDYIAIPVVDPSGYLLDIVLSEAAESPSLPQLDTPVVIMAGGKGTRLEPYTRILPKPLIPVGELPIIEHIMRSFERYACTDFHVVVNYKKQLIKAYFGENERHYNISWYDEAAPLGTGGGLSLLKGKLKRTFFFTNCDILLQSDYADMLKFHRESGNAVTVVGAYKNLTIPYGVMDIGEGGILESIHEKPEFSFLTNTGMYLVEPCVLEDIEDNVSVGFPDIIERQRDKGRKVAVYPVSEHEWLDMGQLEELKKMEERLAQHGQS